MHHNFYFLRQLTKALARRMTDAVVSACFSQSRDELIIRFEVGAESFHIRASLSPALSCLSFPVKFERARKNSVDLFDPIIGTRVAGLRQFDNERSFAILLSDNHTLLFKMHGARANIILFHKDAVTDVFRKNITADFNIDLGNLDRTIDWSRKHFFQNIDRLPSVYFTFGKVVWHYLAERNFTAMSEEDKWAEFQALLRLLNDPQYYITVVNEKPALALVTTGDIKATLTDPLEAANEFYYYSTQQHTLLREKGELAAYIRAKLDAGEKYCAKNSKRLDELLQDNHYKVWADVLMANLHAINAGAESVVLENFYDNQQPIEIKLRKDLSPQKMAEVYYRKAKNQHIEIERLEQSIQQKQQEMESLRLWLGEVESIKDLKAIRALASQVAPAREAKKDQSVPYHEFVFRDFRILVGKNAHANDVLTLKYGYKDDLWLHAKDVSGSHVLIKHQSGKNFPKEVIAYAASLAAFNSKRKNESLCPVIVTPRKFVRKRKGDPPGAVVVEREEVVMAAPNIN